MVASLYKCIESSFAITLQPSENEIVLWDGFDTPAKEDAVRFFSGKSCLDVLMHLQNLEHEPVHNAAYYLEEWSVLTPDAMRYYLRSYLWFLVETLSGNNLNEHYISSFLSELQQVMSIYKTSAFTPQQLTTLENIIKQLSEEAKLPERFGYFAQDIKNNATQLLESLEAARCT